MLTRLNIKVWTKFWRLTTISDTYVDKKYRYIKSRIDCICSCWKKTSVFSSQLIRWSTKSCWCIVDELRRRKWLDNPVSKHCMWWTKIYEIRKWMHRRCREKNHRSYKNYWGRWIFVCDDRNNFNIFYRDMWDRPEWCSLDRIDNNWNYCKKNCKRSTYREQANNRRNNIYYEWKTVKERSRISWIKYTTILKRLNDFNINIFDATKPKDEFKKIRATCWRRVLW